MSIAIDAALILILVICIWRGFRTGFINGICAVLAVVIAIYGGSLVARVYSSEFTGMLEPFVTGIIDKRVAEIMVKDESGNNKPMPLPQDGEKEEKKSSLSEKLRNVDIEKIGSDNFNFEEYSIDRENISSLPENRLDVYVVSHTVLCDFGLSEKFANDAALQTAQGTETVGQEMVTVLTKVFCDRLTFVAIFMVAFLLIFIIFSAIGNFLNLSFGVPEHENVNHISGAVFGALRGIIIILVIGCFFRYINIILSGKFIEDTLIMQKIIHSNIIADILNI